MELTLEDMERELAEAERRLREDVKIGLATGQNQWRKPRSASHKPAKVHSQSGTSNNHGRNTSKPRQVTFANTPQVIKVYNESNLYGDRINKVGEENFSRNAVPRSPLLEHAATALKMSRDMRERQERDQRVLQMLREQENALVLQHRDQNDAKRLEYTKYKQHQHQEQQKYDRVEANEQQKYQHYQRTSHVDQHQRLHNQHKEQPAQYVQQNVYSTEDNIDRPSSSAVNQRVRACDDNILLPTVSVNFLLVIQNFAYLTFGIKI